MFISNTITMTGEWPVIWKLASEIENWPTVLPHYRKVKILERYGEDRFSAYMSAWRDILPVSWTSNQPRLYSDDPAQAQVRYNHVKGVTTGMEVVWTFTPTGTPNEYKIEITHDWQPKWPLIGKVASGFICTQIVHNIADKTLANIKRHALEQSQLSTVASQ